MNLPAIDTQINKIFPFTCSDMICFNEKYYWSGIKENMEKLKGSQRKYLRSLAHHLKPVVMVGRNGVSPQLIKSVDTALNDHELIKVKFLEFKEDKKEISVQIGQSTKSEVVGIIGNIAIFYRQHQEPELRKIII
jgi:RNA-binding protein